MFPFCVLSHLYSQDILELTGYSDPSFLFYMYNKESDETSYLGGSQDIQIIINVSEEFVYTRWGNFIRTYKKGNFYNSTYIHSEVPFSVDRILNGSIYLRFYIGDSVVYISKKTLIENNLLALSDFPKRLNKMVYRNGTPSQIYSELFSTIDFVTECKKHDFIVDKDYVKSFEMYEIYKDIDKLWIHIFCNEDPELLYLYQLEYFSPKQYLALKRNQIFASYGRDFHTNWINEYFMIQPWYNYNENFNDDLLTEFDLEEIQYLKNLENQLGKAPN